MVSLRYWCFCFNCGNFKISFLKYPIMTYSICANQRNCSENSHQGDGVMTKLPSLKKNQFSPTSLY